MTNKQLRTAISKQCGFNKTQPQRLLESIIPNKAIQVCNAGDWPTVEDQQRYWQERDEHLDKIESNALWFDNKAKTERHPFA